MTRARVPLSEYVTEYSVRNKADEDIPVYSVTNSQGFCTEYFGKEVASKDKTTYKIVPRGYFAYNPSRINVGSIDWQRHEDRVIVSPLYNVFAVSDKMDKQYLYYFLRSDIGRQMIQAKATGSVRDNLKIEMLKEMTVPDMAVDEQRRCAAVLDRLHGLIVLRQQQLAALDTLIKARFVEMFGDPISNPKGWDSVRLLELGSCKNGMNFHTDDAGVEVHCLGVGDFKDKSVISDTSVLPLVSLNEMPSGEYLLQDGDIVFVRSNGNKALVGRCLAVFPGQIQTTFSGFCIRFRKSSHKVTTEYLIHVLKTESMRKKMQGRGANIQNLNQQILGSLSIPVPPVDIQNRFSECVSQIDKSKLMSRIY